MKTVLFWTRIRRDSYDEWKLVPGFDESNVPENAWKTLNKMFWQWKTGMRFFPLDEMDAYQLACRAMLQAATYAPELQCASLTTYVVGAARNALLKFCDRDVIKKRDEYTAMFDTCRVVDPEDDEREAGAPGTLDVQAFVATLVGKDPSQRKLSRHLAEKCVNETMAKLSIDTQRGLNAYRYSGGNWLEAMEKYGERTLKGYKYRFDHTWAPAFRRACTWSW